MPEGEIENFTLPRDDWYDADGRIYKDILIENFNAIEAKLNELNSLTGFEVTLPATSEIEYPDTTLQSDDDAIINLRSFLAITGLMGYPLECSFTGNKVNRISFWNSAYSYQTITNVTVNANSSAPYVYLNYNSGTVTASSSTTTPPNSCLIGVFTEGRIICVNDKDFIPVNAFYYLPNMSKTMYNIIFSAGTRDDYNTRAGIGRAGRLIGAADTNTKTSGSNNVIFRDLGRTSS